MAMRACADLFPSQIEASPTLDDDITAILQRHQANFPHALLHSIHYY